MQINIDTDALVHNAQTFREITNCKLCGVVKSNAYGHGIVIVAESINHYVDYFAVSTVNEALQLLSYNKKILVLLPLNVDDIVVAINNSFEIVVDGFSALDRLKNAAIKTNACPHVHIKVDTGMHRLGCLPSQVADITKQLVNSGVIVEGVCTHCAYGDNEVYTSYQRRVFDNSCSDCFNVLGYMPIRHFANTSATLSSCENHYDMVRVGLGLYGYGSELLRPAKSITANVVAVKRVVKGQCIGYDNTYVSPRDCNIAIVDIGYSNGLLANMRDIVVLHDNIGYKVVGKVCMSMIIVDTLTNVLKPFDQVVILGNNTSVQYDSSYSIYELLCNTK